MRLFLFLFSSLLIFMSCINDSVSTSEDAMDNGSLGKSAIESRGFALSFDGDGDYVTVADDPSLDMTDGFTITAWIYLESYTEWASIVTKGNDANNYTIHQSGPVGGSEFGHLRFTGASPALPMYLESETQIPLGEWHHIGVTYNGTTLTFYLDGVEDGGGLLPGPLTPNDQPLNIAADFPGAAEFWHGSIDEVKIWNVALAANMISTAMNGHSSPHAYGLVGLWTFDEASGEATDDRSTYGNDGTLIGDTEWITP